MGRQARLAALTVAKVGRQKKSPPEKAAFQSRSSPAMDDGQYALQYDVGNLEHGLGAHLIAWSWNQSSKTTEEF
jgi:hypothetical protein